MPASSQEPTSTFVHTEPITIQVACRVNRWVPGTELRLVLDDARGRRIFIADQPLKAPPVGQTGTLFAHAAIPASFLRPETYRVSMYTFVHNRTIIDSVTDAFVFVVRDGGSKYLSREDVDYGCVFSPCQWTMKYADRPAVRETA